MVARPPARRPVASDAGAVCSVQELWGKAQSYLEASLAIAPSAEGHIRMAELKTQSEQPGEACRHYQKALALCRAQ